MNGLLQDLRYGIRVLAKAPGFTAASVLALALGIGANSTMFSALEGAVLRPFPFPHESQLMNIYTTRPATGGAVVWAVARRLRRLPARQPQF